MDQGPCYPYIQQIFINYEGIVYEPNFWLSFVNLNHPLEVGIWNKFPRNGSACGPGG